jgi:hypothetical protein
MKRFLPLAALLSTFALAAPAVAQTPPYVDSQCGTWQGDTWTPSSTCSGTPFKHERLAGTIVSVKGHLVTLQQTERTVVIDDTQALTNELTGKVAVGRQVVAHGYWANGTFYATLLTTGPPAPA